MARFARQTRINVRLSDEITPPVEHLWKQFRPSMCSAEANLLITFEQCHGTFGSLTFRVFEINLASIGSPLWLGESCTGGML